MIRAKLDVKGQKSDETFLFEPDYSEFCGQGLRIVGATVSPDLDNKVVLVIDNCPTKLKKGMLLGTVSPMIIDPTPKEREVARGDPAIALIAEKLDVDPKEQVLKAVQVNATWLSQEEKQMQDLLIEYADIFPLDSADLGTTDQITHSINTGDHVLMTATSEAALLT